MKRIHGDKASLPMITPKILSMPYQPTSNSAADKEISDGQTADKVGRSLIQSL